LIRRLKGDLRGIDHPNGRPCCVIYDGGHEVKEINKKIKTQNMKMHEYLIFFFFEYVAQFEQGSICAMNFLRSNGDFVGYTEVEKLAAAHGIHLRVGLLLFMFVAVFFLFFFVFCLFCFCFFCFFH
jgi:hypothetical protein